jgi:hypothetical protein
MTDAQKAAIDMLDERFGGHGRLFNDLWKRSDGLPPAIEGWFGSMFIHIEPDGSTHS